jgi:hypothetical protein
MSKYAISVKDKRYLSSIVEQIFFSDMRGETPEDILTKLLDDYAKELGYDVKRIEKETIILDKRLPKLKAMDMHKYMEMCENSEKRNK